MGTNREKLFSVTLADCDVQTFRSGGPGGQHQNKTETGVRIIHRASGARGECREERSQLLNKRKAFRRMAESGKFRAWLNREIWLRSNGRSGSKPDDTDIPDNIRVEVRRNGRWVIE